MWHHCRWKNSTPFFISAKLEPLPKAAEHTNADWTSDCSFFSIHANDNQVKEGFRRGEFHLHSEQSQSHRGRQILRLTFAFLSPKVPVEKICKRRRAHGSDQTAKRSSGLPRSV